jgi:putative ABC transport system permease protein
MRITSRRHEARLHLPDLLELTDDSPDPLFRESVSAINVALVDPEDAEEFARDLTLRMPGLVVAPAGRPADGRNPFVVLERFHLAIALVTVLGSTAFLLALMVMRADERRETVGILRLIGFSRRRVLLEVFVEGLFVAVSGALFGLVLAAAMQGAFNRFFQWHYDTALIFVRVTAPIAWRCIAFAVPLGVLAGIVASWTLLRREVLELLRR